MQTAVAHSRLHKSIITSIESRDRLVPGALCTMPRHRHFSALQLIGVAIRCLIGWDTIMSMLVYDVTGTLTLDK